LSTVCEKNEKCQDPSGGIFFDSHCRQVKPWMAVCCESRQVKAWTALSAVCSV